MNQFRVAIENLTFAEKDFNGDAYVDNVVGEVEKYEINLNYIMPPNRPAVWTIGKPLGEVTLTEEEREECETWLNSFYLINACYLAHASYNGNYDNARVIAYIRTIAVREGLVNPGQEAANHNCKYAYVEELTQEHVDRCGNMQIGGVNVNRLTALFEAVNADNRTNEDNNLIANYILNEARSDYLRETFTDTVCLVAYFFRVRGHHYQEAFLDKMQDIFRACVTTGEQADPGAPWRLVARDGLKAVFPDTLDRFWIDAVKGSRCSGNLQKRIDSAAAGTAAISAIQRGATDLLATFPRVRDHLADSLQELERLTQLTTGEERRWYGSINRKFYNAPAIVIDEGKLGPLASAILAALDSFSSKHPLKQSPALQRISRNSPIAGAVLAKVLTKYADSNLAVEHYAIGNV